MMPVLDYVTYSRSTCPRCSGLLADEDIAYSDWRPADDDYEPRLERRVMMLCPHCDHSDEKVQRKPLRHQ